MGLQLVVAPAEEPLSTAEAKLHLRIPEDQTAEDGLVDSLVRAAREHCEDVTRRALVTQTWKLALDAFPSGCTTDDREIELPKAPLVSVTSVKYIDSAGAQQTLASSEYAVDAISKPGTIVPAYGKSWPATRAVRNAIEIVFVCGYGTAAEVPASIKQAMKLLIGHWYENREAVVTGTISTPIQMAVDALLWPHRLLEFA